MKFLEKFLSQYLRKTLKIPRSISEETVRGVSERSLGRSQNRILVVIFVILVRISKRIHGGSSEEALLEGFL